MIMGYIRVSTKRQEKGASLDEQRDVLLAHGCEVIYSDTYTGTSMDRPEFDKMKAALKPGDTVIFTMLDRVARTVFEAYNLIMEWVDAGVTVTILNMGTLDNTPTGRLILHVLLAVSKFERDMIVERMQGARAYRRANDPNYKEGRPRKYSRAQLDHAMDLVKDHSYTQVAAMTGISRATVVREARVRGVRKSLA